MIFNEHFLCYTPYQDASFFVNVFALVLLFNLYFRAVGSCVKHTRSKHAMVFSHRKGGVDLEHESTLQRQTCIGKNKCHF